MGFLDRLADLGLVEKDQDKSKIPAISDEEAEKIIAEDQRTRSADPATKSIPKVKPLAPLQVKPSGPESGQTTQGPATKLRVDVAADLGTIYQASKVPTPPHGYTVDKVASMLANPRFSSMAPEVREAAVLASLESLGVPVLDLVTDARVRYEALEAYEVWFTGKQKAADLEAEATATKLQQELDAVIAQVTGQIATLRSGASTRGQALSDWKTRKGVEVQKLHTIASMACAGSTVPNPIPEPAVSQGNPFLQSQDLQMVGGFQPFQAPDRR